MPSQSGSGTSASLRSSRSASSGLTASLAGAFVLLLPMEYRMCLETLVRLAYHARLRW